MNNALHNLNPSRQRRGSFTLVELMIVATIIAVLASTVLYAMYGVTEDAREQRTEVQIIKIHQMIEDQWQSYSTRKVPIRLPSRSPSNATAILNRSMIRLHAIRELMRMEMPDRITDLIWSPTPTPVAPVAISPPSLWRAHRRKAGLTTLVGSQNEQQWLRDQSAWPSARPSLADVTPFWTVQFQGSECLYLILSSMKEGDRPALDFFKKSEIGDVDGDGHFEILDAWGRPIEFIRWAPGFESALQNREIADELDPFRVDWRWETDYRWQDGDLLDKPFSLFPLIYSAGRDGEYQITADNDLQQRRLAYADPEGTGYPGMLTHLPNDPYLRTVAGPWLGSPTGLPGDADNITNHLLGVN